ncbi:flap endonuclease GEN 2-like protein [Trifolium pratense]|uniref:Flap endonuclease GEN 2-like protein n=1 Tax=Trifolium pratense TaxID=57577 RepID=A0A2K3PAS7_TRIPR|nr:flap endonuclease GEN 2-like protein [Trifolium pratense]
MGVKNLWDILESCKKTVPLHNLQNKRVCVDLSCWMVQLQNEASRSGGFDSNGCVYSVKLGISPIAGSKGQCDGSIPAIKLSTYRRRLNNGKEVAQNETNLHKVTSLRRNMGSEFSCMIKEAKVLGMALGISCLNGIEEAEAQCALLNSESLCDGCFSSDSDIFLFGARTVYRDICLGDGGYVVCYEMADIERKLGFGRDSLIALSLLLGSDYYPGVHGLGPESACQIVKSIGDKFILKKFAYEGLGWVKKRKGAENNIGRDDTIVEVINAYLKPKCHSADSDVVLRALAQYPFERIKLQQICAEFFEWPSERTDGYILPGIAERDLRRFANLRLTSSELGLNLPLHEIPVKCPLSEIIKSRRAQGRECYEVSWKDMDGLETSIVPADLIESACPEKISEFEERKALRKKQNVQKRRPKKKAETTASLAELDLTLQNLLLDNNLEDETDNNVSESDSSGRILGEITAMAESDLNTENLILSRDNRENNEWIQNISNITSNETVPSIDKNVVIDLLSPTPIKQSHNSSKFHRSSDQNIEVINLSDSENEVSPEHKEKAKELRLFLASIRNEIH